MEEAAQKRLAFLHKGPPIVESGHQHFEHIVFSFVVSI
jgi:hypothetical protein